MEDSSWIINLANSICGVSLLALPYCFSQCGIILGSILLMISALLTVWSTQLLTDCVFHTKTLSCEGIAYKIYGTFGKLLLQLNSVLLMLGTCSAFFVIISDLAPIVFSWATSVSGPYVKVLILSLLAVSIVLPLSLLRQLDSLSNISKVSMCFYAWLTIQLLVYSLEKVNVTSGHVRLWRTSGVFHVLPIYSMAFACHLQLIAIIKEIIGEVHEEDNENCNRIKWICKISIFIIAFVYGSVALFGHITFAAAGVSGDILSNFDDGIVAQSTRIGFTSSVVVSFPFMVNPCRSTLYSFIFGKTDNYIPSNRHIYITVGILITSFLIAVCTPNVELILALTGAVCGAIICYIFPAMSYLYLTSSTESNDRWKAKIVLVVGVFLLFGGTIASLYPPASHESTVIENLGQNGVKLNEQVLENDKPIEQVLKPVLKPVEPVLKPLLQQDDHNKPAVPLVDTTVKKADIAGRVLNSHTDSNSTERQISDKERRGVDENKKPNSTQELYHVDNKLKSNDESKVDHLLKDQQIHNNKSYPS